MQEAGADPSLELAFTIADGLEYIRYYSNLSLAMSLLRTYSIDMLIVAASNLACQSIRLHRACRSSLESA